ncbi:MAG: hypothetical protein COB71_00090 [Thiotrichales bacterium]|nr:MAG: hypothetical protein COB71_00090 [Thiotrichales bacterium]
MGLGAYPDLSLQNARAKRTESLALLAQDIDPKQSRDKEPLEEREKHSNTLEQVAQRWFEVKKSRVTAGYADDIWRSLELQSSLRLATYPFVVSSL